MKSVAKTKGLSKQDAKYLAIIDERLAEIKAIHKDIQRSRRRGQKVQARIDRGLQEIEATIDRMY